MKERILANLVHLGMNITTRAKACDPLACDDGEWRLITARMAEKGYNMILIDLNEGVKYESRPEIAVKGAWSVEKLRAELARLRKLGLEPIPKLNFSAMHDEWLGDYGRMLCTGEYYRACGDLIRECIAIFDNPRFFHIGYDEEDIRNQSNHEHVSLRQGELWWHDFLWFVKTVEAAGSRTWIWSDWIWEHHDEFLRRCPRSVLQSNWYYDQGFNERAFRWPRIKCYLDLDKAGFDQIATASNNVFASNAAETVEFCERNLSDGLLKGYLMSSWRRCLPSERDRNLEAVDLMAEACKKHIR
jgi:hypothetical protein